MSDSDINDKEDIEERRFDHEATEEWGLRTANEAYDSEEERKNAGVYQMNGGGGVK